MIHFLLHQMSFIVWLMKQEELGLVLEKNSMEYLNLKKDHLFLKDQFILQKKLKKVNYLQKIILK